MAQYTDKKCTYLLVVLLQKITVGVMNTHTQTHTHKHTPACCIAPASHSWLHIQNTHIPACCIATMNRSWRHKHTYTHAHTPACCIAPMSHRWQHIHKQTRTCLLVVLLQESTVGVMNTHTDTHTNTHTCLLYCSGESQLASYTKHAHTCLL